MKWYRSPVSSTARATLAPRCLGLLLTMTLVVGGPAIGTNAAMVQIVPAADAYVESSAPNSNTGTLASLFVGDMQPNFPNSIARSYLRFNLSVLPAGAVVDSAQLYIYNNVIFYPAVTVGAHFLPTDTWIESGAGSITWNNAPTNFNLAPTDMDTISMCVWTSWSVTSDVQTELAGDGVYSVVMKEPAVDEGAGGNYVCFNSREDPQPTDRPYLEVWYTIVSSVQQTSWSRIKSMFMSPTVAMENA